MNYLLTRKNNTNGQKELIKFLKKKGKKPNVIETFLEMLEDYETFLRDHWKKTNNRKIDH